MAYWCNSSEISRTFLNLYRWLSILVLWAFCGEPFLWLIYNSTNRHLILFGNFYSIKFLEGRSCLIRKSIPPPFEVWFSLYCLEKPYIRNLAEGKESSILVSPIKKMPEFAAIFHEKRSNLFLIELMLVVWVLGGTRPKTIE